jgi:hypothetical protein
VVSIAASRAVRAKTATPIEARISVSNDNTRSSHLRRTLSPNQNGTYCRWRPSDRKAERPIAQLLNWRASGVFAGRRLRRLPQTRRSRRRRAGVLLVASPRNFYETRHSRTCADCQPGARPYCCAPRRLRWTTSRSATNIAPSGAKKAAPFGMHLNVASSMPSLSVCRQRCSGRNLVSWSVR